MANPSQQLSLSTETLLDFDHPGVGPLVPRMKRKTYGDIHGNVVKLWTELKYDRLAQIEGAAIAEIKVLSEKALTPQDKARYLQILSTVRPGTVMKVRLIGGCHF